MERIDPAFKSYFPHPGRGYRWSIHPKFLSFSRIPMQLEKNDVVPTSSQDEALARYSVSREVPCSILKWETVLGSLDATPKVP